MNVIAARRKVLSGIVVVLVLLGLIVPAAMAATAPPLILPPGPVTAAYGTYLGGTLGAFDITFSGIPAGSFDVANGTVYAGWCLEDGHLNNQTASGGITLYSSYDPNLPAELATYHAPLPPPPATFVIGQSIPWKELNFLLNNPPAATGGFSRIQLTQAAVKQLIYGFNTNPNLSGSAQAQQAVDNAVNLAKANPTFVPAPGQIIAVIMRADGIDGNTDNFQETVIELTVPPYYDRGDLPANYPTLIADSGPSHLVGPNLFMGQCVDAESNGQPNDSALGDDPAVNAPSYGICTQQAPPPNDDEDGVTRVLGKGGASNGGGWTNGTVTGGGGGAVQVTITGGPACLGAFFDFNRDATTGNLQSVELRDLSGNNVVTQPLDAGTYTFYFNIPGNTFNPSGPSQQPLYARFRVTSPINNSCASSTAFSPTGQAPDGEVEDYQWNFGPNAVTLSGMSASSAAAPLALPLGLVTLLGVLVGGIVLARRPV